MAQSHSLALARASPTWCGGGESPIDEAFLDLSKIDDRETVGRDPRATVLKWAGISSRDVFTAIDHVLLSPELFERLEAVEVPRHDVTEVGDHLPIVVRMTVP